jgi:hypothetical protein
MVHISVRDLFDPKAIVLLEELSQLKKINELIETRTHDLPGIKYVS